MIKLDPSRIPHGLPRISIKPTNSCSRAVCFVGRHFKTRVTGPQHAGKESPNFEKSKIKPMGRYGEHQNAEEKYLIDIISPTTYSRIKEISVVATAGLRWRNRSRYGCLFVSKSDGGATPLLPMSIDNYSNPRRNTVIVEVQVTIDGPKAAVWAAITNIENASETISGIENIEVLEKPANGLVGLKWRETRMLFGKPATAEKWITDAAENEFYKTRAESDGFVFLSTMSMSESNGGITLTSSHDSKPQSIVARLMSIPMEVLFKGVAKKALLQDLNDIKYAVEQE